MGLRRQGEKPRWVLEPVRDSQRCLSVVGGQSQHGVCHLARILTHWAGRSRPQHRGYWLQFQTCTLLAINALPVTQGGQVQFGDCLYRGRLLTPGTCCFRSHREPKRDMGNMAMSRALQFLVLPCKPVTPAVNISQ